MKAALLSYCATSSISRESSFSIIVLSPVSTNNELGEHVKSAGKTATQLRHHFVSSVDWLRRQHVSDWLGQVAQPVNQSKRSNLQSLLNF